jgi:hypothetical protein
MLVPTEFLLEQRAVSKHPLLRGLSDGRCGLLPFSPSARSRPSGLKLRRRKRERERERERERVREGERARDRERERERQRQREIELALSKSTLAHLPKLTLSLPKPLTA